MKEILRDNSYENLNENLGNILSRVEVDNILAIKKAPDKH